MLSDADDPSEECKNSGHITWGVHLWVSLNYNTVQKRESSLFGLDSYLSALLIFPFLVSEGVSPLVTMSRKYQLSRTTEILRM